jgi:hypothetical protein
VELEQDNSSSTSLSRTVVAAWHGNNIGKHAWLTGQATIAAHRNKEEEKKLTGVLTEEQGQRPWWRHDGVATVLAARPPSRGCDGERAASCSRPSGRAQHGSDVGVADGHPTDVATRGHHNHPGARTRALARLAGADQAVGARSTGRSSAAMAGIGGEDDESPRSEGRARQGGAHAP